MSGEALKGLPPSPMVQAEGLPEDVAIDGFVTEQTSGLSAASLSSGEARSSGTAAIPPSICTHTSFCRARELWHEQLDEALQHALQRPLPSAARKQPESGGLAFAIRKGLSRKFSVARVPDQATEEARAGPLVAGLAEATARAVVACAYGVVFLLQFLTYTALRESAESRSHAYRVAWLALTVAWGVQACLILNSFSTRNLLCAASRSERRASRG